MKTKRRRVSREQVRKNAKEGAGGNKWLNLPDGVKEFRPEKPGRYRISILPYEVTDENHPDNVDKGVVWYKRGFRVHFKDGQSYVCPRSVKKEALCYDCREWMKRKKAGQDEDELRPFQGQMFEMYNIEDPEDEDAVAIFCMSYGKFAKTLKEELEQSDEENLLFFDIGKGVGKVLHVRFNEKKFQGKKFLQATKIDFKPRKSKDEEEVFGKVVNLDKVLRILDQDKLKKMFKQIDDEDEDSEEKTEKRKKSAKRAKELAKKHPSPLKHQRDDEDEKPSKKGKKLKGKKKCPIKGGKFGRDCDKFKKCAKCPLYEACEAASGD